MSTRADAIAAAGAVLAADRAERNALPPRLAAERAYYPGGPSIDVIEARIRHNRADTDQAPAEPVDEGLGHKPSGPLCATERSRSMATRATRDFFSV